MNWNESEPILEKAVKAAAGERRFQAAEVLPLVIKAQTATGEIPAEKAFGGATGLTLPLPLPASGALNAVAGGNGAAGWLSWLNPIAGGIAGLFSRGGEAPEPVLTPYVRPPRQQYEAGFGERSAQAVRMADRDERGVSREVSERAARQVVVQVQAMDSRSFLDHTGEIAEAVRRALLESEGLTATLGDLRG
ncbi:MAG: hypothetical protein HY858_02455 [Candidatus Solibacter usitatus]|nr:hypothetical protein [Candidatus Solibacter usitatus]